MWPIWHGVAEMETCPSPLLSWLQLHLAHSMSLWSQLADGSIISFLSTLLLTTQLVVLMCMPMHSSCCSTLHCSGLQNNSVFLSNSLFSLVLVTPPDLVSSSGLHSRTFFVVGHPGGNKVKAVLKVSWSARSPSLLCASLSSHASSVPVNLVISPIQRWEKLDAWGRAWSRVQDVAGSHCIFWLCWKTRPTSWRAS